jgi:hypothetical protein
MSPLFNSLPHLTDPFILLDYDHIWLFSRSQPVSTTYKRTHTHTHSQHTPQQQLVLQKGQQCQNHALLSTCG